MITHATRSAITKLLLLVALVFIGLSPVWAAAERVTIVVALDLTQSVQAAGPDAKTDFQKNIEAVSRLLGRVPPSSRVVVLGTTDKSFAQPYILLSSRVTDDAGHSGERLESARGELVRVWKQRSAKLKPEFSYTDIFGALLVAEQIFAESPNRERHVLVILSDMRQHTPDLDLESGSSVPTLSAVKKQKAGPSPRCRMLKCTSQGSAVLESQSRIGRVSRSFGASISKVLVPSSGPIPLCVN